MDWLFKILKNPWLLGTLIGIVGSLIVFVALTNYEIREFNALGFQFVNPEQLEIEIQEINANLEETNRELESEKGNTEQLNKRIVALIEDKKECVLIKSGYDSIKIENITLKNEFQLLQSEINQIKNKQYDDCTMESDADLLDKKDFTLYIGDIRRVSELDFELIFKKMEKFLLESTIVSIYVKADSESTFRLKVNRAATFTLNGRAYFLLVYDLDDDTSRISLRIFRS